MSFLRKTTSPICLAVALLVCLIRCGYAQEPTAEELEKWFEDDQRLLPFETEINEGKLSFLKTAPQKPALHSINQLTISASSLSDGWVQLYQCYENLDPVPDAQVVYQYKQLKNLTVDKAEKIEKAWVQDQSVQLSNIAKGAILCVRAEVHIFYPNLDGSFTLKNGPFQRKFLDGYFPMHVTLNIIYPDDLLIFKSTKPANQTGFDVQKKKGQVNISAWFEGMLFTEVTFSRKLSGR